MQAHLVRTFTAPAGPQQSRLQSSNSSTSIHQASNHHDSTTSSNSNPSRSSDSTQSTSASTLFAFPPPTPSVASTATLVTGGPMGGGPIQAMDNVINRTGDINDSPFQMCMTLRARLTGVPGFEEQCLEVEDELEEDSENPVLVLWNVFRKGYPLINIYNLLNPADQLSVDEAKISEAKRPQHAAYKFTQACIQSLGFAQQDCFMMMDLKGTEREVNMTGFVKVLKQVIRVVDIMVAKGILQAPSDLGPGPQPAPGQPPKKSHRDHVVDELVRTERTYVQHLELLQAFEKHVLQSGAISGDIVHAIFLNLDDLLEFQRRFLVRIEQVNAQPIEAQNWGRLFYHYSKVTNEMDKPKDFRVYEPFIENQKHCEDTTMKVFDKLRLAGGPPELQQMVESPTHLTSFLLKPFQRLSKYPLLLRELKDKGGLSDDDERKQELANAIESVIAVLQRTNAVLDKEERDEAVKELKSQVEDWKHHRVEAFGELLLYGTHTVVKGDPTKDSEREYRMYLFEKILLCCKEINPNKPKNKVRTQPPALKNGKPRLQLKGRIFMQNVTETKYSSRPGQYTCKIFWRGDDTIESFFIRYVQEDEMKKWTSRIETQRRVCHEQARLQAETSNTTFSSLHNLNLTNPYAEDDDDDDAGYEGSNSSTLWSRNASSTSVQSRNRSGTGGSNFSRTERPVMPPNSMPKVGGLNVVTRNDGMTSPSESIHKGGSYFSPGADSPNSSRASTASSILPFPRQPVSSQQWVHNDPQRYTAPAPARDPHGNYYDLYGSKLSGRHAQELAAIRNRSMSSSEMSRRSNQNAPPVPSVPHNLLNGNSNVNRSQNNSPMSPADYMKPSGGYQQRSYHESANYGRNQSEDSMSHHTPNLTPLSIDSAAGAVSPPLNSASTMGPLQPSQLKIKVKVPTEGSSMMLVVSNNISFESLKDRIDAKLQRITNVSLAAGSVKLKYLFDDEYVSIQTDEDVQTAFETWREEQAESGGSFGEIELFCHPVNQTR